MVSDEAKKIIIERAEMVRTVLAQVPMLESEEARHAGNVVYYCCRNALCHTPEEEEIYDEVFNHRMPVTVGDMLEYQEAAAEVEGKPKFPKA